MKSPTEIVQLMMANDEFSKWLGAEIQSIGEGFCELSMLTRKEMLNGFGILHGGITYSLADSALAFAANSFGNHALSVETSISHHQKVALDERIYARAFPIFKGVKFSNFQVEVRNEKSEIVASFKGTVYNSHRLW